MNRGGRPKKGAVKPSEPATMSKVKVLLEALFDKRREEEKREERKE